MLRFLLLLFMATTLAACGGGGGGSSNPAGGEPARAPVISSFGASSTTITAGQSVVLSWQVAGADTLTLDNGVGTVTGNSVTVTPAVSALYTLTARNSVGTATASVPVTVSAAPSALSDPNAPFAVSYRGSDLDTASRQPLGGTEFRILVSHKGRLYGGLDSFRESPPAGVARGAARIVVKETAASPWRIDRTFDQPLPPGAPRQPGRPAIRHEGVTALASVMFRNDGSGQPLDQPVTLLVAGMRDFLSGLSVYVRDDANGTWSENVVERLATSESTVRSLGAHRDKVTGADLLLVGGNPGGVYSATYDRARGLTFRVPAEIPYSPASQNESVRPMAFAVCAGDAFVAQAPFIYRRIDGSNPRWEAVVDYSSQFTPILNGPSGLRGLTCVERPGGAGPSLIAGFEGIGQVFRIDRVGTGWQVASPPEYDVNRELSLLVGQTVDYTIIANNTFTPLVDPDTGQTVHLMTVQTRPALSDDAWYTIRSANGAHVLRTIRSTAFMPGLSLRSTRSAILSPFPEENGRVVYIAGYDVVDDPSYNTAYVLRAGIRTVLGTASNPLSQ